MMLGSLASHIFSFPWDHYLLTVPFTELNFALCSVFPLGSALLYYPGYSHSRSCFLVWQSLVCLMLLFLWPHSQQREVLTPGTEAEPQLQFMPQWQQWNIPYNPLCRAGDGTLASAVTQATAGGFLTQDPTAENPLFLFYMKELRRKLITLRRWRRFHLLHICRYGSFDRTLSWWESWQLCSWVSFSTSIFTLNSVNQKSRVRSPQAANSTGPE